MKTKLIVLLSAVFAIVCVSGTISEVSAAGTFVGKWDTSWQRVGGDKEVAKGDMVIKTDTKVATDLDGVIIVPGLDDVMWGSLTNEKNTWKWEGTWFNNAENKKGTFTLFLSSNGKKFTGHYTQEGFPGETFWWRGDKIK